MMDGKKGACQDVTAPGQARKLEASGGAATTSSTDFSTCVFERQGTIASVLGVGVRSALTAKEIQQILELPDTRTVTAEIERERSSIPICASNGEHQGYYLPESADELGAYIDALSRRVSRIKRTRSNLKKIHDRMTGKGGDVDG